MKKKNSKNNRQKKYELLEKISKKVQNHDWYIHDELIEKLIELEFMDRKIHKEGLVPLIHYLAFKGNLDLEEFSKFINEYESPLGLASSLQMENVGKEYK